MDGAEGDIQWTGFKKLFPCIGQSQPPTLPCRRWASLNWPSCRQWRISQPGDCWCKEEDTLLRTWRESLSNSAYSYEFEMQCTRRWWTTAFASCAISRSNVTPEVPTSNKVVTNLASPTSFTSWCASPPNGVAATLFCIEMTAFGTEVEMYNDRVLPMVTVSYTHLTLRTN